jgi:hypothetical protein
VRPVTHTYRDPLDEIWLAAARRIGFRIGRTPDAYAHADGKGTILLGTAETLDADDCLAQMILHELCHALVEGPDAWSKADWGLDNTSLKDEVRETACLRLQAALTGPRGLRQVLAPTTDHRPIFDALPADPLTPRREGSVVLARLGLARARKAPFAPHLEEALDATAALARLVPASDGSLWSVAEAPAARHPTGLFAGDSAKTCESCAWRAGATCRQAGRRVDASWPACERHEPALDCQECGACCREAYHSVTVSRRDPVVKKHPSLVVARESYLEIRREGDRCAALSVGERYACEIYEDRPRPCRGFTASSANCLEARRRVGLTS